MSVQPSLLSLPQGWPWVLLLAAFFGGLAGVAHGLRANQARFPSKENGMDFLFGALAGMLGVGLLRPGDALGIATTAGLAGWFHDTFLTRRASEPSAELPTASDTTENH